MGTLLLMTVILDIFSFLSRKLKNKTDNKFFWTKAEGAVKSFDWEEGKEKRINKVTRFRFSFVFHVLQSLIYAWVLVWTLVLSYF